MKEIKKRNEVRRNRKEIENDTCFRIPASTIWELVQNNIAEPKKTGPCRHYSEETFRLLSKLFISFVGLTQVSELPDQTNREMEKKLKECFGRTKIDTTYLLRRLKRENLLTLSNKDQYVQEL